MAVGGWSTASAVVAVVAVVVAVVVVVAAVVSAVVAFVVAAVVVVVVAVTFVVVAVVVAFVVAAVVVVVVAITFVVVDVVVAAASLKKVCLIFDVNVSAFSFLQSNKTSWSQSNEKSQLLLRRLRKTNCFFNNFLLLGIFEDSKSSSLLKITYI